jgi:hypothetical protein
MDPRGCFRKLLLLRNIDWERGESIRQQYNLPSPNGTSNDVFIVGEVLEGIQLEWFKPDKESGSGEFTFLRLRLACHKIARQIDVLFIKIGASYGTKPRKFLLILY